MEISYENTADHLEDFFRHLLKHDPSLKKQQRSAIVKTPLLLILAFACIGHVKDDISFTVVGSLAGLVSFLWALRHYHRLPKKLAYKHAGTSPIESALCRHDVTISDDRFEERTAETRNSSTWRALHKIEYCDDYVFVIPFPGMAHIIPRRSIGDQVFEEFVGLTKHYSEAAAVTTVDR